MCAHSVDVRFEAWRRRIESAASVDLVLGTVRLYLSAWPPEALAQLPHDLAATALPDAEAIFVRAIVASRMELGIKGDEPGCTLLREMALTMSAAAVRIRALEAYRTVAPLKPANLGPGFPQGVQGRLEAEVRTKA
jgi:hypothetical protein